MIEVLDVSVRAWAVCARRAAIVGVTPEQVLRGMAAAYVLYREEAAALLIFGTIRVEAVGGVLRFRSADDREVSVLKSA